MPPTEIFVDGKWQPGNATSFQSTCPVDEKIIWQGNAADGSQVDAAFESARRAFGDWSRTPSQHRIEMVQRFADLVNDAKEELALLIAQETGKVIWETQTEAASVVAKVGVSIEAFQSRRDKTSFEMGEVTAVTRF